jgi:hypothetical protein
MYKIAYGKYLYTTEVGEVRWKAVLMAIKDVDFKKY